tara:strand:- start:1033 stop:1779 length:747 start_codon:yes stop_codon:yes gene_type:complete
MATIDFIIPSFNSAGLTRIAITSFERFKKTHNFRYIVVENSNSIEDRDKLLEDFSNVIWVQNPTDLRGSHANATALEKGMEMVNTKHVFMCHNDVVATSETWMDYFISKIAEGYSLVGASSDQSRIKAVHQSGLLVESEIARSVSFYPVYNEGKMLLDVADSLTKFCRDSGLSYFVCDNTFNKPELAGSIKEERYKDVRIDRALDEDGNVIFLHLGRGTRKHSGHYHKPGRVLYPEWVELTTKILGIK